MAAIATVPSGGKVAKPLIAKWATTEDYAQAQSRQNEMRRRDFLLGRATLRALLTLMTGIYDWRIRPDAKGKPQAFAPTHTPGPYISISHTPGLIACTVSEAGQVGIDVEYWRTRNFIALADYAFGPREREEVAQNGISAFYRIWTLREAISKATGNGIMSTFDGNDWATDAPASGSWMTNTWRLFYISPRPNYSLAVASAGKNSEITIIDLAAENTQ